MDIETDLENIIENILSNLKQKIENNLLNDTEVNQKLNDDFMKTLDDSSCDSSSEDETIKIDKKKSQNLVDTDDEEEIKNQKYLKTKDELSIDDFGPVEYFEIHLEPNVKLERIGKVISKVDNKLVVIQSLKENTDQKPPTLDEETYLFDSNKNCIGKIFETFGPVVNPFYVVRFNNLNDIENQNLNLDLNSEVFIAQSNQYTKYVFNIDVLRKQKGSDASWSNDNEPPAECLDYSDDEQEKVAKKKLKGSRVKLVGDYSDPDSETKKSPHKNFKNSTQNSTTQNTAQKRRHDQRPANTNGYPNQPSIHNAFYYPGAMYPPHPYPFYPNPQMFNYGYPPQMHSPYLNYYQQPMPRQHNFQPAEKNFVNNNNPNVVKKKF
ncbi:H ACA ribonucleo complex non-core subunit NAF1 [Brachionus plicatilis]|uniref:H/ACA ribonucleoprotein complex non-core subunit NAF1 n=1 Tax=Brachionus plicatilis TaxID=10195 RepID=A0A3M7PME0_BRAPC|nr:H ACA ribonucleo complex non-core subunit NAF1 [Brachionus plicatilis]